MRFMMILIPKGYESAAPDAVPSAEAAAKMMEYNQSLQKAGVLLACDGPLRLRRGRVFHSQTATPRLRTGRLLRPKK
jgi:hypothetical protein